MYAGGALKYLAVDSDGFPIDPKESTDVVSILLIDKLMVNQLAYILHNLMNDCTIPVNPTAD